MTLHDISFRRAILLACTAVAALQYQCHAFSSYPSSLARSSDARINLPQHHHHLSANGNVDRIGTKLELSGKATDDEEDRSRPKIVVIKTHEEYVNFLEEDDRLCVIKFYANWCKSCQRFGAKYRHLAFEEGDHTIGTEGSIVHSGEVRFAEVEYTASAKLCKALKVKKLPTVHMHRKGKGKLADMTCKPSLFHLVTDELHRLMEDPEAVPNNIEVVQTELKGTLGSEIKHDVNSNANVTSTSFDSLSDEIMTSLKKKAVEKEEVKEKNSWFPFSF
eukprot:833368_1